MSIFTTVLYLILPLRTLFDWLSKPLNDKTRSWTYQKKKFDFLSDYDWENPITKEDADKKFYDDFIERFKNDKSKQNII